DEDALVKDSVEIVVQLSGKIKGRPTVPSGLSAEQLSDYVRSLPLFAELTAGKQVIKIIAIPDKLVNIVAK
ncbi:MAG: hypothetical protein PHO24_06515, partial [Clostridia bacterium]|nr:hypothetical protein [Clostridia bacterium]